MGDEQLDVRRIEGHSARDPYTPLKSEAPNTLAGALEVDPEEFYDAVWQDTVEPLPSLPT